jgi:hypothetical protein
MLTAALPDNVLLLGADRIEKYLFLVEVVYRAIAGNTLIKYVILFAIF